MPLVHSHSSKPGEPSQALHSIEDSVLDTVRKNVRGAMLASESPEIAKATLLALSNHPRRCRAASLVVRLGWKEWKEQQKQLMLNCGVVSALILSVMISVATERLDPHGARDEWEESREGFSDAFLGMNILSVLCAMGSVIWSLLGVIFFDLYAIDLEDLMYVGKFFKGGLVSMYMLMLSSIFAILALACAMVVLLPNPTATVFFSITIAGGLVLLIGGWVIYCMCDRKACGDYADKHRDLYNQVIEEVSQELQKDRLVATPAGQHEATV